MPPLTTPQPDPSPEALSAFEQTRTQHENAITQTWSEQSQIEQRIFQLRHALPSPTSLLRQKHITYLTRHLSHLPSSYTSFDALQGWTAFWLVHALTLLNEPIAPHLATALVTHLTSCIDKVQGGYGAGPGQSAHLASTFSTVMALCALGTESALASIDVSGLSRLLRALKQSDGSFRVSQGGETDVRATYCALAVASLVGLLDAPEGPELKRGCAEYIAGLQAFDGGIGGEPGAEAHGGNSYCGFAALVILGETDAVDVEALLDWAVMRQMPFEGGFQGRANKLVDSCYSFWVGALFPLLAIAKGGCKRTAALFDADAVARYVLDCCQVQNGGLRDKPGVAKDFMHSCYALSGLSVAQHYGGAKCEERDMVEKINPVYNLTMERFTRAWEFFRGK